MRRGRGRLAAALITLLMLAVLIGSWGTAAGAVACKGGDCESHWQTNPS
jgi:hypothetical protein